MHPWKKKEKSSSGAKRSKVDESQRIFCSSSGCGQLAGLCSWFGRNTLEAISPLLLITESKHGYVWTHIVRGDFWRVKNWSFVPRLLCYTAFFCCWWCTIFLTKMPSRLFFAERFQGSFEDPVPCFALQGVLQVCQDRAPGDVEEGRMPERWERIHSWIRAWAIDVKMVVFNLLGNFKPRFAFQRWNRG